MCVIIVKHEGKHVPTTVLRKSAIVNPHGLGVIWLDTYEVTYHKSKDYQILETERPFIAHFRYATIGSIGKANTHPFPCGKKSHELLMMNGTIRHLGDKKKSDTKHLAELLGETPRQDWKKELEQYECRFITANTVNKSYQIYNKELWTVLDGVWYSKDNVLPKTLVAVYGTLKRGHGNYYRHLTDSTFIGSGTTKERYPLVIKGLPYLINEAGKGFNVEVDVFEVTDSVLKNLDILEGHPNWYRRQIVPIKMKYGGIKNCYIYFNIKEKSAGHEMHATYTGYVKQVKVSRPPKQKKRKSSKTDEVLFNNWREFHNKYGLNYSDIEEDIDMPNIEEETPVCPDCFHDVEFDGMSNYHCSGCDGWFRSSEVIQFGTQL